MNANSGSVELNIERSFEFAKSIVEDPSILEDIPDGATLVLIPEDDPDAAKDKLKLGMEAAERGEDVYIRHVRSLRVTPRSS